MVANVNQFAVLGIEYLFYAARISNIPQGTSGTALAAGSGAGMGRLRGVTGVTVAEPTAPVLNILGNNGVVGRFIGQPQELPSGEITLSVFDTVFHSLANGTKTYVDGDYDYFVGFPSCFEFGDMCWVINCPAQSQETGSIGTSGWAVYEVFLVNGQSRAFTPFATNTVKEFGGTLSFNLSDTDLFGVSLTDANYGATKMVGRATFSPYPVTYHSLIGNNVVTTLVLDETPAVDSANGIQVYVNGTALTWVASGATGSQFSLSGSTVTFGTAPASNAEVVVRYQFTPSC